MSKVQKIVLSGVAALFPFAALADVNTTIGTVSQVTNFVGQTLPKLFFGLALVYFFWGLLQYVGGSGDEKKQEAAKNIMIYGIIILFVMASVWGLVNLLQNATGTTGGSVTIPTI